MAYAQQTFAQNIFFFSSKQGLSNSCIRNLYEDSRHNVWITTKNGLNRHDGVKINVYRHEDSDSTSLLHDESTCVMEYDHDNVLVGTGVGLQMYNYGTDKFSVVPVYINETQTISPRIIRLDHLRSGKTMVCMAGYGCGELMKDKNGKVYVKLLTNYNLGENFDFPTQFFEDKGKRLWIITSRQQLYRQTGKDSFKQYEQFSDAIKICETESGKMYIATISNGLYRYDSKSDSFVQVATSGECGIVSNMNNWFNNELIICADGGGMRIFSEKANTIKQSTIQVNDFNLATSNVKDAIIDSFGNVWVGIYWKGVMMKPVGQSAFDYVGRHSITKNSLGTNSIVALAPTADNRILVATDNNGLYLMAADGTSSTHINPDNNPGMPRNFTAIAPMKDGSMLLGSFFDGLYRLKDGKVSLLTRDIKFIFDIQPADNNCYWIASMGQRLFYYNATSNTFFHHSDELYKDIKEEERVTNRYVLCVLQSGKKLFVGTQSGLNIATVKEGGKIADRKILLEYVVIRHLVKADNKIWVATDKGLYGIDINTLDIKHYTTADGLPINSLKSIIAKDDKLWIGSDYGLICFDTRNEEIETFFDADGLQDNEFEAKAATSLNGNLYFGGVGGVNYFNPQNLIGNKKENKKMHLRLVDLFLSNKPIHVGDMSGNYNILTRNIDDETEVNLNHTDNRFSIQLNIDGAHNQHITYEYSINGKDWVTEGQSIDRIVLGNLEPGTYDIKIRAHSFNMSSDERSIKVIIHAPWYASTIAKLIYFLIFLLVCWLSYEFARRQIQARKVIMRHKQEKEINEARIQFFMNISHEIRTPMTLILAPLEKLIGNDKDPERQRNYMLMKQNSNRILRLINQMMDVRKIEQGKFVLDYHQVELVSVLQNIFDVFITNSQNRKIKYEFIHDTDSLVAFVDPENIDKIVMNLLSNAFKFTPDGGSIVLSLKSPEASDSTEAPSFTISVSDNGCGIKDEDKAKVFDRFYSAGHQNGYIGTGIGLNLTSMLVQLHKGDIMVEDNPEGSGTRFVLNIPVGDKSLVTYTPTLETENAAEEKKEETADIEMVEEDFLTAESEKAGDTHNRNILLVEDDENIRQYVRSELSGTFSIHECSNGQEAWDYTISHPNKVNVIISDIMMPVMDGMTLCQKVKSNFTTNHIPVILMTALGSDADRIAGITNGADAYISKPFNIDVLQSTALNLMKTRRMLQGKFNGEKQQEEKIDKMEIESPDEHLMRRVMKCINANMSNPELSVEMIADQVGISRVHFYRKMKDLTGQSPRDYLKYVRLKEAARLLQEKRNLDITSVSVAVGFKSLSSFSTNFKALFGKTPSEWAEANQSAK